MGAQTYVPELSFFHILSQLRLVFIHRTTVMVSFLLLNQPAAANTNTGFADRSVIWVTPIADADIYIDYDNSGDNFGIFPRAKLSSSKFVDQDSDMVGVRQLN